MNVSQGFVAQIMKNIDPVGVDTRQGRALRRCLHYGKSPNRVWYLHSYDKFKPFEFESKGFIDGYSRCILWLNLLRSKKDPKEVCNVFVNYMTVTKGVPQRAALILGQNILMKGSQRYPRRTHEDDLAVHSSFLFEKPRVVVIFFQRTCLQWHIQQHRVFTSRVFQIFCYLR